MTTDAQFPLALGARAAATKAVARATDPATSHVAASKITEATMRVQHRIVLSRLRALGPMHDGALFEAVTQHMAQHDLGGISESGCRTRRKELCDAGLVRDSGRKIALASGNKATVWEAVEVTP